MSQQAAKYEKDAFKGSFGRTGKIGSLNMLMREKDYNTEPESNDPHTFRRHRQTGKQQNTLDENLFRSIEMCNKLKKGTTEGEQRFSLKLGSQFRRSQASGSGAGSFAKIPSQKKMLGERVEVRSLKLTDLKEARLRKCSVSRGGGGACSESEDETGQR